MYNELLTRSFSKHEQKKMSIWAISCSLTAFIFCALLNSYITPTPILNFQLPTGLNLKVFSISENHLDGIVANCSASNTSKPSLAMEVVRAKPSPSLICDFSLPRSDFCELKGEVRVQRNSSATIYVITSTSFVDPINVTSLKLKPYARKQDDFVNKMVKEVSLVSPSSIDELPECSVNHNIPAIVFSSGGYAGNHFHDFSDILVPLYLTARPFKGEVQFLVTDIKPFWLIKYKAYLDGLSNYEILDLDHAKEVHCFRSMIVGLKGHKEFGIEPSLSSEGYTMRSFTEFVRSAYSLKRSKVGSVRAGKPRLLIISRKGWRALVNEEEVAGEARRLGYEVEVVDAKRNLRDFSKIVNSFDVMLGVHGAGMTNSVFLPENAILIQVVPLGLEWVSKHSFELPAEAMKLRYLEYKISWKESSLADKYSEDHPLMKSPQLLRKQGWFPFKKMFLDGQNVRIDVANFTHTLLKALELLRE